MNTDRNTAPPVVYPIDPPKGLPWAALLFCLGMAVPLLAWHFVGAMPAGWVHGGVALWWVVLTTIVLQRALRPVRGVLQWDGLDWHWHRPGTPSQTLDSVPAVLMDIPWVMGLRWQQPWPQGALWFWVWRATAPSRWLALRRALFQRPRPSAPESDPQASPSPPPSFQGR